MDLTYSLGAVQVYAVTAIRSGDLVEEEVEWKIVVGEDELPRGDETEAYAWPIMGLLHGRGPGGSGQAIVTGLLRSPVNTPPLALANEEAAETLYDIARAHLVGQLATDDADVTLPHKAPEPAFEAFPSQQPE